MEIERVLDSIAWITTYIESSFNMRRDALQIENVLKIMQPLYNELGYPDPISKPLYRILDLDNRNTEKNNKFTVKRKYVTSTTLNNNITMLEQIADDVGKDDWFVTELLGSYKVVYSPAYLSKILKWANSKNEVSINPYQLETIESGITWQEEVVLANKSLIQLDIGITHAYPNNTINENKMKNTILESYQKMKEVYSPMEQDKAPAMNYNEPIMAQGEDSDQVDTITLDVPLMIRMVEMGREEIADDEQLHRIIQNIISVSNQKQGEPLTMDDYNAIVQDEKEQFKMEPSSEEY